MNKLYIVSQGFEENKGSYYGFVEGLAKSASKKYNVTILCGLTKKTLRKYEKLDYAEVHRFPVAGFSLFKHISYILILALHVSNYFKKNKLREGDIIIANGDAAVGVVNRRYILRAPDQPVRTFLRNMDIAKKETSLLSRIARRLHFTMFLPIDSLITKKAAGIIYSSMENRRECIKYYGVKKIPHFVPNKDIKFEYLNKGRKHKIKGTKILFVSSGKEKVRKGIIYLERVIPVIFKKFINVKLIHVGEKFSWDIPKWCKGRIISVGKVPWSRIREYYKSSDIFVFCSLNEGIPTVLMEAMATGLAIVSSDIEGVEEYVRHMKEGYICKRGDSKGLENGLVYMLTNLRKGKEMGRRAQKRIKSVDQQIFWKELIRFSEQVYKGNRGPINLLTSKS
ncbi:glycosyltransferase family 4 protein [Candidatus Woesearchaeota archaeon]|nr:glycosyltransferase family 4 protein [Candidatus Woesearchaeota archaeon]